MVIGCLVGWWWWWFEKFVSCWGEALDDFHLINELALYTIWSFSGFSFNCGWDSFSFSFCNSSFAFLLSHSSTPFSLFTCSLHQCLTRSIPRRSEVVVVVAVIVMVTTEGDQSFEWLDCRLQTVQIFFCFSSSSSWLANWRTMRPVIRMLFSFLLFDFVFSSSCCFAFNSVFVKFLVKTLNSALLVQMTKRKKEECHQKAIQGTKSFFSWLPLPSPLSTKCLA